LRRYRAGGTNPNGSGGCGGGGWFYGHNGGAGGNNDGHGSAGGIGAGGARMEHPSHELTYISIKTEKDRKIAP